MRLPVMLVDSDSIAAGQLASQLRHAGFSIETVGRLADALEFLEYRVCSITVVVADLVDGEDFQESLTDLRHAAPKAWILVVTDHALPRALQIVRECGADELIVAPFRLETLIRYLATHIGLTRPLS